MKAVYIQTVEELTAVLRTPESLVLEFKSTIDKWNIPKTTKEWEKRRAEGQQETCRDIAQFANTNGGCLLIGVQERVDPVTQRKVADGICGVSDPEGMKDWIEKAIHNFLVPATFSHDIKEIHDPNGVVLAVNIPPSIHLVALWHSEKKSQFEEKQSIEYLYRDSHGKKWMNPDEVEMHIMNGSRAAKLAFDAAFAEAPQGQVHIAGGCWQRSSSSSTGARDEAWPSAWVTVGRVTDRCFELQFTFGDNTLPLYLPYGLIKEAWVGPDECLNLWLALRVVYWRNQLLIEP